MLELTNISRSSGRSVGFNAERGQNPIVLLEEQKNANFFQILERIFLQN